MTADFGALVERAKYVIDSHILYGHECGCGLACATDDAYTLHLATAALEAIGLPALLERVEAAEAKVVAASGVEALEAITAAQINGDPLELAEAKMRWWWASAQMLRRERDASATFAHLAAHDEAIRAEVREAIAAEIEKCLVDPTLPAQPGPAAMAYASAARIARSTDTTETNQ